MGYLYLTIIFTTIIHVLGYVATIELESNNGTIYFDINDTSVELICRITEAGTINLVSFERLNTSHNIFKTEIEVFVSSCRGQGINFVEATIKCDTVNRKISAVIPKHHIAEEQNWRCEGSVNSMSTGPSATVILLTLVPIENISISPKSIFDVTEDVSVKIYCESAPPCRPNANIKWFSTTGEVTNGVENPEFIKNTSDPTLTTTRVSLTYVGNRSDNGLILYCTGQQINRTRNSTETKLNIKYPPETNPTVVQIPSTPHVDNGTHVILICTVSGGNPLASLSWNCTGTPRNNTSGNIANYSVEFTVNKTDNRKVCSCNGEHFVNAYSPTVPHTLEVFYSPLNPVLKMEPELPWFLGNTTKIICGYTEGNPTSSVIWKHNGSEVNVSEYTFSSVQKENNDDSIQCLVYNDYTTRQGITIQSMVHRLNVEYYPEIQLDVKVNNTIKEGQDISIVCSVYGNPLPIAQWVFPNTNQINVAKNRSDLILVDVNRSANGTYTCLATSNSSKFGVLRASKSIDIIVYYAPDVEVINITQNPVESGNLTLLCNAKGYPAKYTYTGWEHSVNGIVIREGTSLSGSEDRKVLNLVSLNYMDSGTYSCFVTNGIENKQGHLMQVANKPIKIKVAPTQLNLMPVDSKYATNKGENLSIEIDFFTEPDQITAEWFNISSNSSIDKNHVHGITTVLAKQVMEATIYGRTVNISENTYRATLIITDFQEYMQGYYSLIVDNGYQKNTFTFQAVISVWQIQPREGFEVGAVAGGICAAIAIIAAAIFIIHVKRRYLSNPKGTDENNGRRTLTELRTCEDDDLHYNILYGTSGPAANTNPDRNDVAYAMVNKKGDINKFKESGKIQEVQKKQNGQTVVFKTRNGTRQHDQKQVNQDERKNKDGLIYADLDLKPVVNEKIIHGLEHRTNYVDIDFTQKAEPLPVDDSEVDSRDTQNGKTTNHED